MFYFGDSCGNIVEGEKNWLSVYIIQWGGVSIAYLTNSRDRFINGIKVFGCRRGNYLHFFLVVHPKKYEQTASHPHGKANYINGSMNFMADDIPPGEFEEAFYHGMNS